MPFEITGELLLSIGTFIGLVVTAVISYKTHKKTARKDELDTLREEFNNQGIRITNLTDQVDFWQKRYSSLFNYVLLLRTIMINNNLEIPILDIEDANGVTDIEEGGLKNLGVATPKKKKPMVTGAVPPENMPKPSDALKGDVEEKDA